MALGNVELANALVALERQLADETDVAVATQLADRVAAVRREQDSRSRSPELAMLLVNSATRARAHNKVEMTEPD